MAHAGTHALSTSNGQTWPLGGITNPVIEPVLEREKATLSVTSAKDSCHLIPMRKSRDLLSSGQKSTKMSSG